MGYFHELEPRRLLAFAGPDGFGYAASQTAFENLDLVPGQAGVTSFLDDNDDDPALITIPGHSFSFYGTSYTQLYVTPNGLITLGAPPPGDAYNNTDLTTSPTQPTIAPLWDDFLTNTVGTGSGPLNDVLLYTVDTANSRLIIEWNCVRSVSAPSSQFVTFQAILQLDTGSSPGSITFNYPDLDLANLFSDGYGATVGIKAAGAQGPNTLLIKGDHTTISEVSSQTAVNIAIVPPGGSGSISGFVYQDADYDQSFAGADAPLTGLTIWLDLDNDANLDPGEPAQITSAGNYNFSGLADGSYHVRVAGTTHWLPIPAPIAVVSGGGAVSGINLPLVARAYSGTSGNDTFLIRPKPASSNYEVVVNGSTIYLVPPTVPPLVFDGLDGNDTLTLSAALPFHADFHGGTNSADHDTLNINAGAYTYSGDMGVYSAHLHVNVSAGAGITFTGGSQRLGSVNVLGNMTMAANGNSVFQVDTITIGAAGRIDLTDNDLVVENMPFTTVRDMVFAGFGSPTGLSSSSSDGSQILALFDNGLIGATDWIDRSIGANAIVGKYTYFGDANFDGQVTGDDYTIVDSNLNTTPPPGFAWLSGDMNLDGIVTGDDYTTIDSNLNLGVGDPLAPSARPRDLLQEA